MFVTFCDQYREHLASFVLEWSPDDFVFRELAFAIISLASGQALFQSLPQRDCDPNYCLGFDHVHLKSCGYIIASEELGLNGSKVLPEFAIGSHHPGKQPGSALLESIYWFEDVLICLATSLDDERVLKATIARTVQFGTDYKSDFQAVIMSLLDCMLLEVHVENATIVVKHTDLIMLFPLWPEDHLSTDPRERPPAKGGDQFLRSKSLAIFRSEVALKSLEGLSKYFGAFSALVGFFDAAANRRISHDHGRLPVEIYRRILDFTDDITYLSCAKVSRIFRAYCQKNFRVGGRRIVTKHHDPMEFTIIDQQAGSTLNLKATRLSFYLPEHNWSPIIGLDRPTILSKVNLTFTPSSETA